MRRRIALVFGLILVLSLIVATGGANAVVVDTNAIGSTSVAYDPANQSGYLGVALVPGTGSSLATVNVPTVTSSAPCLDPALATDLTLPDNGLCSHGGVTMHSNETFALAWDPVRRYWQTTRKYVEQFLSDVAAGSGTLTSPYADTTQYTDASGRAANASLYGGGCGDYGAQGGASCKFSGPGGGHDSPASVCPVSGSDKFHEGRGGGFGTVPNGICLTEDRKGGV